MRAIGISRAAGGWIKVAVLAIAAVALTGDASSEPVAGASAPRWVSVSTGLVTLRPDRALRLSAVEIDPGRAAREMRVSIIDGKRRVLRHTVQQLTPTNPVFLDLARNEIPPGSDPAAIPLRMVFRLPCSADFAESGPHTSLEIYNTATGETEVSSGCGCPCCGPPIPNGVMTSCGGAYLVAPSSAP